MVAVIYYKYCTCSNGTSSTYNKGCPVHDPDVRNARCSDCIELESALAAANGREGELRVVLECTLSALRIASRQLTEDMKLVLNGKRWGETDIKRAEKLLGIKS